MFAAIFGVCATFAAVPPVPPLAPAKNAADLPPQLRPLPLLAVVHGSNATNEKLENVVTRATIPVLPGDFDPQRQSLVVHDVELDRILTAQAEIVARSGDGSPQVLEAVFPANIAPQATKTLGVFVGPKATATDALKPATMELTARTRDAFGNRYAASLLAKHVRASKQGSHERVDEYFAAMKPDSPSDSTFPQLFRFHTFVATRAGESSPFVQVLVENNAAADPACDFHFDSLEFGCRGRTFVWATSPLAEPPIAREENGVHWAAVVPKLQDGKLNIALDQFLTLFEFHLATPDSVARAKTYAESVPLFVAAPGVDPDGRETRSWHSVPAFGPARLGIPVGQMPLSKLSPALDAECRAYFRSPPSFTKAGPFWVHGDRSGAAPSGEEIAFTSPWAAKFIHGGGHVECWSVLKTTFLAVLHRQRYGFWNADGSVWTLADSLKKDPATGVEYTPSLNINRGRPYPDQWAESFGRNQRKASEVWRKHQSQVESKGLKPDYEETLRDFDNFDDQHLTRFTQYLIPLVWLSNDPAAKHLLEVQAAVAMAATSPFPTNPTETPMLGLAGMLHRLKREKHRGLPDLDRGMGWNIHAVVAGLKTSDNSKLQELGRRWRRDWVQVLETAQLPNGGLMRRDEGKKVTLDVNGDGRIDDSERDVEVEHASIYMQGVLRLAGGRALQDVFDPKLEADELKRLSTVLAKLDRYFITFGWNEREHLPYWDVTVNLKSAPHQPLTKHVDGSTWGSGEDAAFYFDDVLAEAALHSGDETYLADYLAPMHGGRRNRIDPYGGNSMHAAWLLQRWIPDPKRKP